MRLEVLSRLSCCRVQLTVIDTEGRRTTLRGLEGQTLVEVLAEHYKELGGDRAPHFCELHCILSEIDEQVPLQRALGCVACT